MRCSIWLTRTLMWLSYLSSMLISQTQQIADSARAKRLPTVYGYREHVVDGGLINSDGVDSPASVSKKGRILLVNPGFYSLAA